MRIDPGTSLVTTFGPAMRGTRPTGNGAFEQLFRQSIADVNQLQREAERLQEASLSGQVFAPGVVETAVVKAELAFNTLLQIRNKLVEAVQELRQLQI